MTLFEKFRDGKEKAFRDEFVKPLLNRLGFHGVDQQHGSQEFGKDFVFSEHHRLAGFRHYAAQVKHVEAISQKNDLDDLLRQIREAFTVPFKRSDSPRDCYVSAVFVFNSGAITPNAITSISNALAREHYGDNVHLLDGDRLQSMNEFSMYQDERDARMRLAGLYAQLHINTKLLDSLLSIDPGSKEPQTVDTRGFLLHAAEVYLTYPLETDELYRLLIRYVHLARIVDGVAKRIYIGIADSIREQEVGAMRKIITLLKADSPLF